MAEHMCILLTRLRRSLAADPGRFAGGSAVCDPLGLLAVEQNACRRAVPPGTRGDLEPGTRAPARVSTGASRSPQARPLRAAGWAEHGPPSSPREGATSWTTSLRLW